MKLDEINILYHGTGIYHDEDEIDGEKYSSPYNDFGRGYYVTSHWKQAEILARRRNRKECWVFEYELSHEYQGLKIKEFLNYDADWLEFILKHRIRGEENPFDIVYDRMADNRVNTLVSALYEYASGYADAQHTLNIISFYQQNRDQYCFKNLAVRRLLKRTHTYRFSDGTWKEEFL